MASPDPDTLIEYPSLFPIKVMGANAPGFAQAMLDIVLQFDPSYDRSTLQTLPSRGGKYLGLTFSVTATSRAQLDALYRALSGHPLVKVVL
jgi:putative lipoic acid-binding regulatory protein